MLSDLRLLACAVLKADSIETKLAALDMLANAAASGWDIDVSAQGEDVARPGRPERPLLVPPKLLPKRSLLQEEGRAALLHAIAHRVRVMSHTMSHQIRSRLSHKGKSSCLWRRRQCSACSRRTGASSAVGVVAR